MEACRFSYYTVWLTLKVRQWPVEVTSWNQSTSSLQSPTILSEEKKDCRQTDSRLSRVSTRAPGYAFVCVAAVYLLLSSERLCLQTNRKIVCQPAHGIYTHEPDFCKISFTVQSMWVDRPPPILCRSPFFFPFFFGFLFRSLFLYLPIHLIQAQCGCGRKRWKSQRIGSWETCYVPCRSHVIITNRVRASVRLQTVRGAD